MLISRICSLRDMTCFCVVEVSSKCSPHVFRGSPSPGRGSEHRGARRALPPPLDPHLHTVTPAATGNPPTETEDRRPEADGMGWCQRRTLSWWWSWCSCVVYPSELSGGQSSSRRLGDHAQKKPLGLAQNLGRIQLTKHIRVFNIQSFFF